MTRTRQKQKIVLTIKGPLIVVYLSEKPFLLYSLTRQSGLFNIYSKGT